MSQSRAMRRKIQRERMREAAKPQVAKNAATAGASMTGNELAEVLGVKINTLCDWLDARDKELRDAMSEEAAGMLWEAENYIAVADIIIILWAVKKTFGDLKTLPKRMNSLVEGINDAMDDINQMGVEKAYESLHNDFGVELQFEEFDFSKIFENQTWGQQIVERIRLSITGRSYE